MEDVLYGAGKLNIATSKKRSIEYDAISAKYFLNTLRGGSNFTAIIMGLQILSDQRQLLLIFLELSSRNLKSRFLTSRTRKDLSASSNSSINQNLIFKSQFIELFGDPNINPKGWKQSTVGQECYYIKDGPHKSPPYIDDPTGIPFISTRNVVNGDGIDWSTAKYISEESYRECIKKCKPEKGDILYSKGGTTGIAKLVDTDIKFANWVHVAVLKFGSNLDGKFFECMLNTDYCYAQSQQLTKGVVNRDFVLSAIAKVKIIVPPLPLQLEFVDFIKQLDKSKFELKQAIANISELMKSLIQQDFSN